MPGWSRKCPLGVPLIVHILTLAGPDPFLRAVVGVDQGGSDFRDFGVHSFLLSSKRQGLTAVLRHKRQGEGKGKLHLKLQSDDLPSEHN